MFNFLQKKNTVDEKEIIEIKKKEDDIDIQEIIAEITTNPKMSLQEIVAKHPEIIKKIMKSI